MGLLAVRLWQALWGISEWRWIHSSKLENMLVISQM